MPATYTLSSTNFVVPVGKFDTQVKVASTSGLTPGSRLFADRELMQVVSLDVSTLVNVRRGVDGTLAERHGEVLKAMLSTRDPKRGMNILLYGAPGTGKTSFARSLAAEVGLACYEVVQNTNRAGAVAQGGPLHRFAALQICASQVNSASSLLIIDEADDMLRGRDSCGMGSPFDRGRDDSGDKGLLNSVLDSVQAPCVWIANADPESLAPSSRRRFGMQTPAT